MSEEMPIRDISIREGEFNSERPLTERLAEFGETMQKATTALLGHRGELTFVNAVSSLEQETQNGPFGTPVLNQQFLDLRKFITIDPNATDMQKAAVLGNFLGLVYKTVEVTMDPTTSYVTSDSPIGEHPAIPSPKAPIIVDSTAQSSGE